MRKLDFARKKMAVAKAADSDVSFIKLCALGVAAIFAITVLITVLVVNLA